MSSAGQFAKTVGTFADEHASNLTAPFEVSSAIKEDYKVTPLEIALVIADYCLYLEGHFKVLDKIMPNLKITALMRSSPVLGDAIAAIDIGVQAAKIVESVRNKKVPTDDIFLAIAADLAAIGSHVSLYVAAGSLVTGVGAGAAPAIGAFAATMAITSVALSLASSIEGFGFDNSTGFMDSVATAATKAYEAYSYVDNLYSGSKLEYYIGAILNTTGENYGVQYSFEQDSLYVPAMVSLLQTLDHDTDSNTAYRIFRGTQRDINNEVSAEAQCKTILLNLAKIFNVTLGDLQGESGDENYHQGIVDVINKMVTSDLTGKLSLQAIETADYRTVAANALLDNELGVATRYALVNMNPFVLVGADEFYDRINSDHSLDVYDPVANTGTLTEKWIEDRALFLRVYASYMSSGDTDGMVNTPFGAPFLGQLGNAVISDSAMLGDHNDLVVDGVDFGIVDPRYLRFGGESSDSLFGRDQDDRLYGSGGNDSLTAHGGDDYLEGGTGFDAYHVGQGHDTILDVDGQGQVFFGDDQLSGGNRMGDTLIWASVDGKYFYHVDGYDLLVTLPNNGNNSLRIKDFLNGELGITLGGAKGLIALYGRVDRVFAGSNDDAITTLDKDDFVIAGAGNDEVYAGDDNDMVYGEAGDDALHGQSGLDFLAGDTGNDRIWGGSNADLIDGGAGNDVLFADEGESDLELSAEAGQGDWLNGGAGNDELYGSARKDFLAGGAGQDKLFGGAGDDVLASDGDYRPDYSPNYIPIVNYSAIQMGIELGILQAALLGMPGLWLDAQTALGQLQSGETILPIGGIGADWMWNANKQKFERSAPGYLLIPKPEAHQWDLAFNDDMGFSLALGVSRPASQFKPAASGGDLDYLEGGKGNDHLYGGAGGDIYLFGLGDGTDTVVDALADGDNEIHFGTGVGRVDVQVTEDATGLQVTYGDQGDAILLPGASREDHVFRSVRLADGTVFDFSELFEHAPEVSDQMPAQTGKPGVPLVIVLPESLFIDPDGDELAYAVTLTDGTALPEWLVFDAATRTLSGVPANGDAIDLELRVTATDPKGLSASQTFVLAIQGLPVWHDVVGTDGDDNFYAQGTAGNDRILGQGGHDALFGLDGDDHLLGGDGDDRLYSGMGTNTLEGGDGNDLLYSEGGDNLLLGGAGDDRFFGGAGDELLDGGTGNDRLFGGAGNDTYALRAGSGHDTLVAYDTGADTIDTLRFEALASTALSLGRDGANLIIAYGDNDRVILENHYQGAAYQIDRIECADTSFTPAELLSILPVSLDEGDSRYSFTDGDDRVAGLGGDDSLYGKNGNDTLYGDGGNDGLFGDAGNDHLLGGAGDDRIFGGQGDDRLEGGAGSDTLYGEFGNNLLLGNEGDDLIQGGTGEDRIQGGVGNDRTYGGMGNDAYVFGRGDGQDVIRDYDATAGNRDTLELGPDIGANDLWFGRNGNTLEVKLLNSADTISFENWFLNETYRVEEFRLNDGTLLQHTQVQTLVAAMANYNAPTEEMMLEDYPAELQQIIGTVWETSEATP